MIYRYISKTITSIKCKFIIKFNNLQEGDFEYLPYYRYICDKDKINRLTKET